MDSKLIDALLIELLQLPEQRRTPEKILANLMLTATAAGVSLTTTAAPLQVEHLQLAAALEHLADQLGSQYRARAMLRLGGGLDGIELGAVVEPHDSSSPLPRFVAFGTTARAALAGINREIRANNAPKAAMPKPRRSGRLALHKLQGQLNKAATA
ncbi:MAG: hypothetical protein KJ945_18750 [Gammaproteobacteria bacterium]|nr:hypothetical protein [Gammaproteobacteria bacterium]MBU0839332.1 hypothetical protein [Gammaproteobacteria bacterium]MBU1803627.1 hypothetical protein [Gammaproteobacteria bacterium]